jgi:hypothetical protein
MARALIWKERDGCVTPVKHPKLVALELVACPSPRFDPLERYCQVEANSAVFETKSLNTRTMNQQLGVAVGGQNANE